VTLSTGAYVQIFPRAFEAAAMNANSAFAGLHGLVALMRGTMAEFVLPGADRDGAVHALAAFGDGGRL